MPDTVSLNVPSRIDGAAIRMTHLLETGYLPTQAASDINTLIAAAMSWQILEKRTADQPR